jgi:hypothetical protein
MNEMSQKLKNRNSSAKIWYFEYQKTNANPQFLHEGSIFGVGMP